MTTTIDTLATYEAIAAAGIDDRGARAISKAIADSVSTYPADVATKADIARLEGDIAGLKASTRADIAELRELVASTQNKTLVWMFGMLLTFAGVIIAVIKLA